MALKFMMVVSDMGKGRHIDYEHNREQNDSAIKLLVENGKKPTNQRGMLECNEGILTFVDHESAENQYNLSEREVLQLHNIECLEDYIYFESVSSLLLCGYEESVIVDIMGEES